LLRPIWAPKSSLAARYVIAPVALTAAVLPGPAQVNVTWVE
jgi:hypothetical protein